MSKFRGDGVGNTDVLIQVSKQMDVIDPDQGGDRGSIADDNQSLLSD